MALVGWHTADERGAALIVVKTYLSENYNTPIAKYLTIRLYLGFILHVVAF